MKKKKKKKKGLKRKEEREKRIGGQWKKGKGVDNRVIKNTFKEKGKKEKRKR